MGHVLTVGASGTAPARIRAELFAAAPRCELAESPRFAHGRWWWVDATAAAVFSATATDGGWQVRSSAYPGRRVPLVHPAGPRWVLVACGTRLEYLRADHSPGPRFGDVAFPGEWLLNDGTADAAGGLWIGAVHPRRAPASGHLLHLTADGALAPAVAGITLSNGLAYDDGPETLFHADSLRRVVLKHRLGKDARVLYSSVHLRFPAGDGMPDGIASDVDGGLWVAVYGTGEVRRFDRHGRLSLVVDVPTPQVTSVALGGTDGRDLLITTAREGYDEARSAAEPLAGRLFVARAPHAGRPVFDVRGVSGPTADG